LVLSQANVRRIKAGVSGGHRAPHASSEHDIGAETGMFGVPAGGRRYRALELLVKQKRLARAAPIPCIELTQGLAEEDSLAENVQRAPLHATDTDAVDVTAVDDVEPEVSSSADQEEAEEDEGLRPIPDRLLTELTAYLALTLRDAVAQSPDVALLATLHAVCLKLFYRYTSDSCLEIDAKSVAFGSQAPGLYDTAVAKAVDERHRRWSDQPPQEPGDLWEALLAFDTDSRHALFAHCVALSINAVHGVHAHSLMPIVSRSPSTSTSRPPGGRQRPTTISAV
jgi:hypothetical protein